MQATATRPLVLVDAVIPASWARSRAHRLAIDAGLMFGFAWFVALCAQIAIRTPWSTVPITGQTFAVLVAGGALGAWRGAGSLLIYMLLGFAMPVFAPGNAALGLQEGWDAHFILPWKGTEAFIWDISSGGYIVGFILAAFAAGWFAERAWDRKPWNLAGMLAGNAILYVPGLLWLYYLIATDWVPAGASRPLGEFIAGSGDWGKTLSGGLYPFVVGDLMKLYLAALTLPAAWALVERVRRWGRPKGDSGSP
jgi:biotin transport system substrate-specific component